MGGKRVKMPVWGWKLLLILVGFGLGTAYYYNMSLSIPKESNCSFSANIWTDILAFIFGIVILAIGFRLKRWEGYVLVALGTAIIVEHIWQLVHNKVPKPKPRALTGGSTAVMHAARNEGGPDSNSVHLGNTGIVQGTVSSGTGTNTHFMRLESSNITIAYETFGNVSDPAVLLIHGLGSDMTVWPEAEFVRPLADAGFYVIRVDCRDSGQSDYLVEDESHDGPTIVRDHFEKMFGISKIGIGVPYRLTDMAQDCVDLLDGLGVKSAIITGHSMGAMVAQTIALEHSQRVDGIVSVASCTGPAVGPHMPSLTDVLKMYLCERRYLPDKIDKIDESTAATIVHGKTMYYHLILGDYTDNWDWHWRANAERVRRMAQGYVEYRRGTSRQMAAISVAPARAEALAGAVEAGKIACPIVAVHGPKDNVVPFSNAEYMEKVVPGVQLLRFEGMGHMICPEICGDLLRVFESTFAPENMSGTSNKKYRQG